MRGSVPRRRCSMWAGGGCGQCGSVGRAVTTWRGAAGTPGSTTHAVQQAKTDFVKLVKAARSEAQLAEIRGRLAAYLRDAVVGLVYAYYEPPGAQMLHNNPLFVRAHDFSGLTTARR